MIDLIIPYYKNKIGLKNTLDSIDFNIFEVTVIDDASEEEYDLDYPVNYIMNDVNSGPGNVRQMGFNLTSNKYVMFIDTGDIFVSKEAQKFIPKAIEEYPETNFFFFQYYHYGKIVNEVDNRMHGKLYKREFLDKYGITFCPESSYMNEDVGFNRTCRIISDAIKVPMMLIKIPIIKQIRCESSLTQRNGAEALYKKQTRALSLVTIHAVNICRKNNIDASLEINQIAIALYYWFIRAVVERPEFIQESWSGAKIFYDYFASDIQSRNITVGNSLVKECIKFRNQVKFPINILRFTVEILKNEKVPSYYLT